MHETQFKISTKIQAIINEHKKQKRIKLDAYFHTEKPERRRGSIPVRVPERKLQILRPAKRNL